MPQLNIVRVDFVRLGAIFRAVRIKRRWRQLDVANKAGVSRTAVSRLERGHARMLGLDDLLRIADALDVAMKLTAAWQGGELDRLINSRHSGLHESVARWMLNQPGWELAPEVSFSVFGERGVIDVLAWHGATRTLLVIELKTEIVDINDLMGRVDVKRRLAAEIARDRGWKAATTIAAWVIVAEGTTNRRRVRAHSTTLRTAFPHDMRLVSGWLASPTVPISALTFWSSAQQGDTSQPLATVKRVRRPLPRAA